MLNFEVDFLKTEVFQIEQNGSQATIFHALLPLNDTIKTPIISDFVAANGIVFHKHILFILFCI